MAKLVLFQRDCMHSDGVVWFDGWAKKKLMYSFNRVPFYGVDNLNFGVIMGAASSAGCHGDLGLGIV